MGIDGSLLGSLRKLAFLPLSVGVSAYVEYQILVKYPDGNADDWDLAAGHLDEIRARVDAGRESMNAAVVRTLGHNKGLAIDAFGRYWSRLSAYLSQVAAFCARLADACRAYAKMLRATQHALLLLAVENAVALAWAIAWVWTGPGVSAPIAEWLTQRLFRQAQGELLVEALETTTFQMFMRLLEQKIPEYVVGASIYTLGDFALADTVKMGFGDSPGSVSDNLEGMAKEFSAALVFWAAWDGVWETTRLGPLTKAFPETAWGNELAEVFSWAVGSTAWTVTGNMENGQDAWPTGTQWLTKLAIILGQRSKAPG